LLGYAPDVVNEGLRRALDDAHMTSEDLASRLEVSPKTVARWLADPGVTPHPRARWSAAEQLGVDESVLWPDGVRTTVKLGADRELVCAYPTRNAVPQTVWRNLIRAAEKELVFCGYTAYFLWFEHPNLGRTLRRKAEAGARVRFLLGGADSELTRRTEAEESRQHPLTLAVRITVTVAELEKIRDAVEARYSDNARHLAVSVWRFDQDMIVTPHLAVSAGHDSPALHLRRRQDDGLYDRFAAHAEALWEAARPVWA